MVFYCIPSHIVLTQITNPLQQLHRLTVPCKYISVAVSGIHLTDISVPEVADIEEKVNLTCTYHMGGHKLNSVKWYKDGMEFFR